MPVPPHEEKSPIDVLLHHCTALDRLDETRPTPFERLSEAVGADFARMLVAALSTDRAIPRVGSLYAA